MAGLHLVIQMSKFREPYLVRKRGIFYLQKRIPQQLTGHYGRTFVRNSLRTTDRLEASKLASQLVRCLAAEVVDTVTSRFKKGKEFAFK